MVFAELLQPLASSGGLNPVVQVAIIGGIFSLLAILLSFLLDRGRPSPPAPAPPIPALDDDLEAELRARIDRLERSLKACSDERRQYRDWLIEARIDLTTGKRRRARPAREDAPT